MPCVPPGRASRSSVTGQLELEQEKELELELELEQERRSGLSSITLWRSPRAIADTSAR